MAIPENPVILLSYINTKLRDDYSSLEIFCENLDVNINDIKEKLTGIGYNYDESLNQFV